MQNRVSLYNSDDELNEWFPSDSVITGLFVYSFLHYHDQTYIN